jgi:hypothetical protein
MNTDNIIYIGFSQVAVYDGKELPYIDVPPGWPNIGTFTKDSPIFKYNEQELKSNFDIQIPVYWNDIIRTKTKEEINLLNLYFNRHKFSDELPNGKIKFIYDKVDNLIQEKKPFYYVISVSTNNCFLNEPFGLSDNIRDGISKNLCKVLFLFLYEGYLSKIEDINWLSHFGQANNLTPSNFIFTHSNLRFQETINKARTENIKINFTYIPLNYFEYKLWFLPNSKSPYIMENNIEYKKILPTFIENNRNKKIVKHFNILNRRPRQHRIILFTEVKSNYKLKDKCEISLGNCGDILSNKNIVDLMENIYLTYPEYKENYEFAKNHNFLIPTELDVNLNENRASEYNRFFYENTFCSLTSETLVSGDILFFSEKTFKPIYNLQPFLFLGNPFSLKKLKEFGYKTFSDWWDESYDEEIDYLKRIKKIAKVMEEICEWSEEKCFSITQEMEELLIHNFNNLMDNKRFEDYALELDRFNKVKNKNLI